eukprot:12918746-Prorocentrum_lima.AAC.1
MIKVPQQQGTTFRTSVEGVRSVPVTSKDVAKSHGECLAGWKCSIRKELDILESLAVATPQDRCGHEGKVRPC